MGLLLFQTGKQLKTTAKIMGAEVVGMVFMGMVSKTQQPKLSEGVLTKINMLADRIGRM